MKFLSLWKFRETTKEKSPCQSKQKKITLPVQGYQGGKVWWVQSILFVCRGSVPGPPFTDKSANTTGYTVWWTNWKCLFPLSTSTVMSQIHVLDPQILGVRCNAGNSMQESASTPVCWHKKVIGIWGMQKICHCFRWWIRMGCPWIAICAQRSGEV